MSELKTLQNEIRLCRKCLEIGYPVSPNPIFSGTENSKVMLIGQAPGIMNELSAYPFNGGQAGKRLFQWLKKAGWEEEHFRNAHYITSVTRCYPGKNQNKHGDRVPTQVEQALCRTWLEKELNLLDIKLIILMGKVSLHVFFDKKTKLDSVIGQVFHINGRRVVPLPHPSGASTWYNKPNNKLLLDQALTHLGNIREELDL